ncbi:arylesterase [Oxalobacter vibrioformis]|uniref:Arylesterase n=1 Tax=Oxalobacter vibrioformis TaxID=933080 RepID=A0A9E9LUW6_9BURK|nr:arylesterase [Oxalobacter vibrioformis]NLC24684.1 arylesterase [Oxalobacter sp.]WAW09304.1 arylesterase [Oxalobacter vibrioformis]
MHSSDKKTGWIRRWFQRSLFALPLCFIFFSVSAHSAPKNILVLGDSLSAEYGIERGTGWVALLQQRLDENKKEVKVINASISGDTTSSGNARLSKLLRQHKPQILILELGGNDGLRGLPVDSIKRNLRAMVSMARRADCQVLILGMQIPPNYGQTYATQFAESYEQVARESNMPLVPFFLAGVADDDGLLQSDRIHPAGKAQPILLDNVWPHLLPMLK